MEREYRQEGELEREQEERTEVEEGGRGEEGEEERTRVAEGEDTFTESSAGLNRGRETSIMRANGRFGGGHGEGKFLECLFNLSLQTSPHSQPWYIVSPTKSRVEGGE